MEICKKFFAVDNSRSSETCGKPQNEQLSRSRSLKYLQIARFEPEALRKKGFTYKVSQRSDVL